MNIAPVDLMIAVAALALLPVIGYQLFRPRYNKTAKRIVANKRLPGKNNVDGRVAEFTPALYKRLCEAKIATHLLTFIWHTYEKPEENYMDSLIVYRDTKGNYWAMDPYSSHPVWVNGDDPQIWLDQMYPGVITLYLNQQNNCDLVAEPFHDREHEHEFSAKIAA